ncbi:hypothetical protein H0H87_007453 [Tephrocybe sp. NHM501043]|nr:hypothetical protein H0H87_007453 [Tephrocybe sp. NHM501043]
MDTTELQQVARHTHRLESNWNVEKPRLSRAVGYDHFSDVECIIAPIPGTSLAVLYGPELDEDLLVVCDGGGTSPPVRFRIGIPIYKAVSIEPGRLFIALVTEVLVVVSQLQVFSVNYGAEKTPSITECFSSRLLVNPDTVRVLFIATNTVGLFGRGDDENYSLNIINFVKNLSITVRMPFKCPYDRGMFCQLIDEIPYIVVSNDDSNDATYELYRCPIPQFGSEENPDLEAVAKEISAKLVRVARFLRPRSHIHSLVEDTIMIPATTRTMLIYRWGNASSWPLLPSRSGAYWIAIVGPDGYKNPELRLIRWDPDPPAIHIRTLDVPSYIDLENIFEKE